MQILSKVSPTYNKKKRFLGFTKVSLYAYL